MEYNTMQQRPIHSFHRPVSAFVRPFRVDINNKMLGVLFQTKRKKQPPLFAIQPNRMFAFLCCLFRVLFKHWIIMIIKQ
jgi:hypothetical protein